MIKNWISLAEEEKKQRKNTSGKLTEREEKKLLAEYNILNQANNSRWSDTLLVDSIMIPGSLLAISWAIAERTSVGKIVIGSFNIPFAGFLPIVALVLIGISYMTHYSTLKLDNFYINRIKEIEDLLDISGHHDINIKVRENLWWKMRLRGYHFFFWVLIIFYIIVSILLFTGFLVS